MGSIQNLVYGSSGLIGSSFLKINKNKKKFIFFSKKKRKFFKYQNLDNKINFKGNKNKKNIFFFASPSFIKKNYKKKILIKEYLWIKKIISIFKIYKLIYISSPSIFYKNSLIGDIKKKCENYIIKNKKKFSFFQIWRPYNLVGASRKLSDHFHNEALKIMFLKKKKFHTFYGSKDDKRGYSRVDDFVKILNKYSKLNKSFIKNYGNRSTITTSEIIDIYNKKYIKKFNFKFKAKFSSKKANMSRIKLNKNSVYSSISSKKIIKNYLDNFLNEKKMQYM